MQLSKPNYLIYSSIVLSFVISFIIVMMINDVNKWSCPDLLTLFMIFWISKAPNNIGIYFACIIGIIFDLLTENLLGSTSFLLSSIAFIYINLKFRSRLYSIWQRFVIVYLLLVYAQLIRYCIQLTIRNSPDITEYWVCSLISILTWPLIIILLNAYQNVFKNLF